MITLRKLAYLFIDEVSGGGKTTDSKLDERDVILKIRQILNEVMALKYFEKYQEGDRSAISMYISTYSLPVLHDTDLNRAYITLPEFNASLPYNRGLHRMWLKSDNDQKDIVISHHPGIGGRIRAGQVADIIYAHQEGLSVIFRNMAVEPDEEPETIITQLIIAGPDSIDKNDPLPIIPEQQAEVLRRLTASYRPTPQDLVINANQHER